MATQTLEELLVMINASTDKLREEMGQGNRAVAKFDKNVGKHVGAIDGRFKKLTGSIRNTIGVLAAGFGAGVLIRKINETANALEEVDRQATSLGASVEGIQELTLTFKEFGLDSNDVSDALGTLADRAQDAQDGMQSFIDDFKLLGVEVDDLRGKRPEELMRLVAERVAGIEDPTRRTAGIVRIFGDDLGRRLNPLLLEGAQGLDKYADRWHELGRIIDDEGVEAGAEAARTFRNLREQLSAEFTQVIARNAESISALADALISAADGAGRFVTGWNAIINNASPFPFEQQIQTTRDRLTALRKEMADLQVTSLTGGGSPELDAIGEQIAAAEQRLERLLQKQRQALELSPPEEGGAIQADPETFRELESAVRAANDAVRRGREELAAFHEEQDRIQSGIRERQAERELERRIDDVTASIEASSDELDQFFKDQEQRAQDAQDAAKELGLTFTSAFEQAIIEGQKLSDVLRGLAQDVLRILVRRTVTEPLTGFISDAIQSRASGGRTDAGVAYRVNEAGMESFMADMPGRIFTASQTERMMRGGGGGSVNQEFNFPLAFPAQLEAFTRNVAGAAGRDAAVQVLNARRGRV